MRVAVGLLTFNRFHLLQRTLRTLQDRAEYPFDLVLVDGGSESQAQRDYVQAAGGECLSIPTVGESMNVVIERCLRFEPDLIVFTADDYDFKEGWLRNLVAFWRTAPSDVALCCLNWEPRYPWNTVVESLNVGGQKVLIRQTLPGSSWSFRASDWAQIGPIEARTGGEDMTIARKLQENGRRLAALDLTIHTGERESAWGNHSWKQAEPLEIAA